MIYLLKTSPHNESFVLDGYSITLEGCKELIAHYIQENTFGPKKEYLNFNFNDDSTEIEAFSNYLGDSWSQTFYIVRVDKQF